MIRGMTPIMADPWDGPAFSSAGDRGSNRTDRRPAIPGNGGFPQAPFFVSFSPRWPDWPWPPHASTPMDIIRIILSVIIPPVGVFLQVGFGLQFWVNILLTILGYFPGLIHALYIILSR